MFIAINFSHETDEKCQKIRINENINQDYPKYLESTRNSITQFRNFNSNLIKQRQEREVASLLQMSFLDPRTQKKLYLIQPIQTTKTSPTHITKIHFEHEQKKPNRTRNAERHKRFQRSI